MDLELCRKLCAESKIIWTQHGLEQMNERDISMADIKHAVIEGEIIENYPDDYPNPSCLIFGHTENDKVIHIVVGCDNAQIYIITAYYPNTVKFEEDLKTRRRFD